MKKKTVLKDIAERVGVSIATVSYVLSKDKESRVSKEVSDKIKKVAKELNYQPNQIAKSLKSGRTNIIGLIVADISNPFFAHIARIIEDETTKLGYTLVISSSDEKVEKSWGLIKFLINRQVDGFIIVPTEQSEEQIKYLKEQKIPFVLMDRYFPEIDTHHVAINNFDAAKKAVQRLIYTGNTKIGIIAYDSTLSHMKERIRGAISAMENNDILVNVNWIKKVRYSTISEDVERSIDELTTGHHPVTAILFTSNSIAMHGIKKIDKLGLDVPTDIAIVSFDQGEAFDFYYSPITYIQQPLTDLGKKAVKILINEIASPDTGYKRINLEANLVIKASCGKEFIEKQIK